VSPMPPPSPMNRQVPVWPTPQAPAPMVYPPVRQASPVPPKKRRNVVVPLLAGLLVLSLAFAAFMVYRINRPKHTGGRPNGAQRATATATQGPSYQGLERPEWLPAGWTLADKRPPNQLWANQDEREGGRCETGGGKLHVTTSGNQVTGCSQPSPLDTRADVA